MITDLFLNGNLSPRMACDLTESLDDFNKVTKFFEDSKYQFNGIYCICLLVIKPEMYKLAFPERDIDEELKKLNDDFAKYRPSKQLKGNGL